MRRSLLVLIWGLVFVAAGYDALFAWQYREGLQLWEQNPLARWAAREMGLLAVLAAKFAGLAFAAWVAFYCGRHRSALQWPLSLTVATAYAGLSLHYVVGLTSSRPGHSPPQAVSFLYRPPR
jgi:hypothetical protein